ncbi:hypothetical protein LX77_03111 [Gelidibacter algens]|uniref:HEAT repeat protein n=1 Tax=Gelidibacter algens TaxID=49280 RepID=A0A1A7R0Q7_9FLAO|nr:hypothetical protein [Gelidibacter algens]OBX25835.1 hypothetical protein A9996_07870 [Gelidibacter algens]RAJ20586.1 hypothetical protein LX77_03111 [Gelidibacter algens]
MYNLTSKELYLANSGQKLYIYKDGFGDVYNATPEEEAEWAKEVVAKNLVKNQTETNSTSLQFAIEALQYHKYPELEDLLLQSLEHTTAVWQIVFASALWTMVNNQQSFDIIYQNLLQHRVDCLNDVFLGLGDFKNHNGARRFVIKCLEGDDDELAVKANVTLSIWAWSGLPELRENKLLDMLQPEHKQQPTFKPAIEQLKQLLNIVN